MASTAAGSDDYRGLSTRAKVGTAVGVTCFFFLLLFVGILFWRRRARSKRTVDENEIPMKEGYDSQSAMPESDGLINLTPKPEGKKDLEEVGLTGTTSGPVPTELPVPHVVYEMDTTTAPQELDGRPR